MKTKKILVLHGPNLNLLGKRELSLYGSFSLKKINAHLKKIARAQKYTLFSYQSNVEGTLVTKIQKWASKVDGILINPAAYTHTSIAIRDVLVAVGIPTVEVHLSNIYKREPFRKQSLISDVVDGQVVGFGPKSYELGLHALIQTIEGPRKGPKERPKERLKT